jgi:hypothetical protein
MLLLTLNMRTFPKYCLFGATGVVDATFDKLQTSAVASDVSGLANILPPFFSSSQPGVVLVFSSTRTFALLSLSFGLCPALEAFIPSHKKYLHSEFFPLGQAKKDRPKFGPRDWTEQSLALRPQRHRGGVRFSTRPTDVVDDDGGGCRGVLNEVDGDSRGFAVTFRFWNDKTRSVTTSLYI